MRRAIATRHKDGLANPTASCAEQENLNPENSAPHSREGLGDQANKASWEPLPIMPPRPINPVLPFHF